MRSSLCVVPVLVALVACSEESVGPSDGDLAVVPVDASEVADLARSEVDADPFPTVDLAGTTDYSQAGTHTVATTMDSAMLDGASVPVAIYLPSGPGPFPVVVISPGYQQTRISYQDYGQRLASHGILTIIHDDGGAFATSTVVADRLVALVDTWLPAEKSRPESVLAGKLSLDKVGLMGHSRGGQAALLAATGELKGKVKAFFGLDPVDTQMGVGLGDRARVALPQIGIPTAFLGETLDGVPIPFSLQACAPAADNYEVLYAAAPAPSLKLTAVGADHFDFQGAGAFGTAFCHEGTASSAGVLSMSVALSAGFFARELLSAPVGPGLEGAGAAAYVQAGLLTRAQK